MIETVPYILGKKAWQNLPPKHPAKKSIAAITVIIISNQFN